METRTTPLKVYSDERTIAHLDLKNLKFIELTTIQNCEVVITGGENNLSNKDIRFFYANSQDNLSDDFLADLQLFTLAMKYDKKLLNFDRTAIIHCILDSVSIIDVTTDLSIVRDINLIDGSKFTVESRRTMLPYFRGTVNNFCVFGTSDHSKNARYYVESERIGPFKGEFEIFATDRAMNFMFFLNDSNFESVKKLIYDFIAHNRVKDLHRKFNKVKKIPENKGVAIEPWNVNELQAINPIGYISPIPSQYVGYSPSDSATTSEFIEDEIREYFTHHHVRTSELFDEEAPVSQIIPGLSPF